jgi:hypothetical protein
MPDSKPQTTPPKSCYERVIDGLKDAAAVIGRAKEIDPGAWSLNGNEPRRHAAIVRAAKEQGEWTEASPHVSDTPTTELPSARNGTDLCTITTGLTWKRDGWGHDGRALYARGIYVGQVENLTHRQESNKRWRAWLMTSEDGSEVGWFTTEDDAKRNLFGAALSGLGGIL